MAVGPEMFREQYEDYSLEQLNNVLKELKKERQEEIDMGIDDNNCVSNIETEIEVIESLIEEKMKLPELKNYKMFIRKYKTDETGNSYEEEDEIEIDLPKFDESLPFTPEKSKYYAKISELLGISIFKCKEYSKKIPEVNATYYYNPNHDGKSIIVGDDGSYLLTVSSAIDFEKLLVEYKSGRRDGNFNMHYENFLQNIMKSYKENGITIHLIEILNNFANGIIKNDKQNIFWSDIARDILKTIIVLNLVEKSEVRIEDLLEQSKDIDKPRQLCKNNLEKLDISKIQTYGNFINSIEIIRKENNDKTLSSILEIIYRELKNNEKVEDIKIKDEKLKNIVREVIGNNDPYWNNPVYDIVKKIIDLPVETDITIAKLINYNPEKAIVDPHTQGRISNLVKTVCKNINIELEATSDEINGLAYYDSFKKIRNNK